MADKSVNPTHSVEIMYIKQLQFCAPPCKYTICKKKKKKENKTEFVL